MAVYNPRQMWFGTIERMGWIKTPLSGADMTPGSWGASGVFLNGGAWARSSWGSHKKYVFEWGESTDRNTAQKIKSYRDGTFGRGLIYFIDPLTYDQNILPARWASPAMAIDEEGPSLVYQNYPTGVSVSGGEALELPITAAYFDLADVDENYRGDDSALFIPIPEGFTLYLGAIYTATGSGGVFASPVTTATGTPERLTEVLVTDTNIVPDTFSGVKGVRLWVGKTSTGAATVTIAAMTARLYPTDRTPPVSFSGGPWVGGMGHSGVRFDPSVEPTWIANTGVNDGQISVAATFIEVGDWA